MGTSGLSLFTSSRCDNRACCVHKREEEEIYETAFVCVYLMDNSRHCFFVWLQLGTLFSWPHLNCIDFHNDKKNICLNGALYIRMITHWIYYYGISEFLMIFLLMRFTRKKKQTFMTFIWFKKMKKPFWKRYFMSQILFKWWLEAKCDSTHTMCQHSFLLNPHTNEIISPIRYAYACKRNYCPIKLTPC